MKYAVIQLQGKQHRVAVGDLLTVDKMPQEVGAEVKVTDVLLTADGEKVTVGQPLIKGASVSLKVVEQGKGEKIEVYKFKAKSRYRRHNGHRQELTNLEVTKIA